MRKVQLLLGLSAGLTLAASQIVAGSEDGANSYDTMGYYVYSTDDPNQMEQNDFDGMYVAIQGGANISLAKYSFTDSNGGTSTDFADTSSGVTDAIAGGYVGWGITWDEFYLGLEGNGRYNFGGGKNDVFSIANGPHTANIDSIQETWSAGVGLKLGGIVYNTALIYLYGGGAYAGFKLDSVVLSNGTDIGATKKDKFGFSIGPGVSVQMNRLLNIDMRYLYRSFGNLNLSHGDGNTTTIRPRDNLVMMAAEFHFDV